MLRDLPQKHHSAIKNEYNTFNDYGCCLVILDQRARRSERQAVWEEISHPSRASLRATRFMPASLDCAPQREEAHRGVCPVLSGEDSAGRRLMSGIYCVRINVIHTKSAWQKPEKLIQITLRSLENIF